LGQADTLVRLQHMDPWVFGDQHRTSRTISVMNTRWGGEGWWLGWGGWGGGWVRDSLLNHRSNYKLQRVDQQQQAESLQLPRVAATTPNPKP